MFCLWGILLLKYLKIFCKNTPAVISLLKFQGTSHLSRETHEVEQIVRGKNPFWILQMKYMINTRILLKTMFVKRNIRGDIVIEKNPFLDFIDVKECQE